MNRPRNTPDNWKEIVIQLREVYESKNITQEEISYKTGMLQSSISRVFSCEFAPKLSTLVIIADALGVELIISDKIKDELK